VNRKELQDLANIRLKEATALLQLGLFDGAYYLAGYAVECGIKACIAKKTRRGDFPDKELALDSYSHNLRKLIKVAGLETQLERHRDHSPAFEQNWAVVVGWSEQSRYETNGPGKAGAMLAAVSDRQHGVMRWIKQQW
jgi:HEPN domain-containing protein